MKSIGDWIDKAVLKKAQCSPMEHQAILLSRFGFGFYIFGWLTY